MSVFAGYFEGWYAEALFVLTFVVTVILFAKRTAKLRAELAVANEAVKLAREREQHVVQERSRSLCRDELTGLANRADVEERLRDLAPALRAGRTCAVLFVNLDRFKDVNEQFGRAFADHVLIEVGARLTASAGPEATVARYSGDEFVVLAPAVASAESVEQLGEALRQTIGAPIEIAGGPLRITASIGMASCPCDGESAETILENADAAARHAKRTGGNRTVMYSCDLFAEARERRHLRDDLSLALLRDEFALHYQPIVELCTGRVVKVEALIRWMHPARGMIGPNTFIPIAERSGLMELIGYWVIEEAVRQAAEWEAKGWRLRVAVNVSARQLDDAGFLPHLTRTLRQAQLPPERLELEITETAAMTDASAAQDVLGRCRELGLTVSLDDFGTYYSSLTYLKRLPIDSVKIDRSFVQGLPHVRNDVAIVSGILSLARALERTVIAEGIESAAQREWLLRAGCRFGQGYLFGRPMSAADIRRQCSANPFVIGDEDDALAG